MITSHTLTYVDQSAHIILSSEQFNMLIGEIRELRNEVKILSSKQDFSTTLSVSPTQIAKTAINELLKNSETAKPLSKNEKKELLIKEAEERNIRDIASKHYKNNL